MLPRRRIGVVAQANGPAGGSATDIVAALAYDLEAGRPNARATATERLDSIVRRLAVARQQVAATDSTRRARQKPLSHPLGEFAGSYNSEAFGTITFTVRDNALQYHWGVLDGPVEVYDAEKNQLRIEVGGSAQVITFNFEGAGPASSITASGTTFRRR
jgi:hypothetical protein